MCVCTHTPRSGLAALTSQPASVHTLPSESAHGVLTFGVHWPVVGSPLPEPLPVSRHGLAMWLWSQTPGPLQPAVVQALLSLSGHGVLSVANVCVCTHTPLVGSPGLASQPAIVHTLPSVSVHGRLTNRLDPHVPPPGVVGSAGHSLARAAWPGEG